MIQVKRDYYKGFTTKKKMNDRKDSIVSTEGRDFEKDHSLLNLTVVGDGSASSRLARKPRPVEAFFK